MGFTVAKDGGHGDKLELWNVQIIFI